MSEDRGGFGMPTIGTSMRVECPEGGFGDHALLMRIAQDFILAPDREGNYRRTDAVTDDARYILAILPDILEKFLMKNAQYARAQTGHDLGIKGIIPDINRKSAAIIERVWGDHDAPAPSQDSTQELLEDLIGHCLLMLAKMREAPEWNAAPAKILHQPYEGSV
jgi:hypothetical protein